MCTIRGNCDSIDGLLFRMLLYSKAYLESPFVVPRTEATPHAPTAQVCPRERDHEAAADKKIRMKHRISIRPKAERERW